MKRAVVVLLLLIANVIASRDIALQCPASATTSNGSALSPATPRVADSAARLPYPEPRDSL